MSLRLRLTRMGAKKRPFYRVVAVDSQKRRDGRALDYLGYYNPMVEPNEVRIDQEKVEFWMQRGAKPSETVRSLLRKSRTTAQD
ncbi:MAG: 30S ribosomal protein S16 [Desulfohalobiaceae bacterium]